MKRMSDVRLEASKRFNPRSLCNFLIRRPNGVVCVDKDRCAPTDADKQLFAVIMHFDYRWRYQDFELCTIFLEENSGVIYGGIYNIAKDEILTRCLISVPKGDGVTELYKYPPDVFTVMCNQIHDAG